MRVKVTLACTECKQRNYVSKKNKKNDPDRIEMMKHCKFCRKHTLHKETKCSEGVFFMAKNTTSEKKSEKKQDNKIVKWFKDLKVEFKKVVWPTKKTVINNTSVVVSVIVASAILVGLIDQGFLAALRSIYNAG